MRRVQTLRDVHPELADLNKEAVRAGGEDSAEPRGVDVRGERFTTLADLCESVRYGYTASARLDPCGPRFLRITDIVPESLSWESVPYCEIDDSDRERFALMVGEAF